MDYQVEFIEKPDHLVAVLSGVRTPVTLVEAAAAVAGHCVVTGSTQVLIDVRMMRGELNTLETYDVAGRSIPQQPGVRELGRAAILDHTRNLGRVRFFETVAINRGLTLKVFDDEELAVAWLRQGARNGTL